MKRPPPDPSPGAFEELEAKDGQFVRRMSPPPGLARRPFFDRLDFCHGGWGRAQIGGGHVVKMTGSTQMQFFSSRRK